MQNIRVKSAGAEDGVMSTGSTVKLTGYRGYCVNKGAEDRESTGSAVQVSITVTVGQEGLGHQGALDRFKSTRCRGKVKSTECRGQVSKQLVFTGSIVNRVQRTCSGQQGAEDRFSQQGAVDHRIISQ